jgi:DNA-binding response OmpR family regulator
VLPSSNFGERLPELAPKGTRYRPGPFELNTGEESLARNGTHVKIQDLPCRLLVVLSERPGEIVTRDEVGRCLCPENTFVEFDNSLGVAIRKVRDVLNDDAEAPRYSFPVGFFFRRMRAPLPAHDLRASTPGQSPIS